MKKTQTTARLFETLIAKHGKEKIAIALINMARAGASNEAFALRATFGIGMQAMQVKDIAEKLGVSTNQVSGLRFEGMTSLQWRLASADQNEKILNLDEIEKLENAFKNKQLVIFEAITIPQGEMAQAVFSMQGEKVILRFPSNAPQDAFRLGEINAQAWDQKLRKRAPWVLQELATLFPIHFEEVHQ